MKTNDPLFGPRQWSLWESREDARDNAALTSFAEKVAAAKREAVETNVCLVCAGEIVDGICQTCEAEYLPFADPTEVQE